MNKFKNKLTEQILNGESIKRLQQEVIKRAKLKLILIINADDLIDLKSPPSNHLEKLKGDRDKQYSIRVNDRYRICFDWINNEAFNIEFIDYHK
jgi:proteic killer suppression protein